MALMPCPIFLKCKEHGRYCFIKTGTTLNSDSYKRSFYICSQVNPCSFQYPACINAVTCSEHSNEIVELQALYHLSPATIRYYYRCNTGKHKNKNHWCGFKALTQDELKDHDIKAAHVVYEIAMAKSTQTNLMANKKPMLPMKHVDQKSGLQQEVNKSKSEEPPKVQHNVVLLLNMQRDLKSKKDLLSKVKLSSLPDNGNKLQQQITDLEQQINKMQLFGNEKAIAIPTSGNKENAIVANKPVPPPKPPMDHFQKLYADHPVYTPLYMGTMNPTVKREIVAVTREAVEKLHTSLETKPKETDEVSSPASLTVPLMLHQRQALAWLLWRETQHPPGGILADDMGLGKTLTMIALILKDKEQLQKKDANDGKHTSKVAGTAIITANTTLVICPASLLYHWECEVKERCTEGLMHVHIYHGPKRNCSASTLASFDMVVTTYDIIRSEIQVDKEVNGKVAVGRSEGKGNSPLLKIGFRRIILDEGHIIRNPKTNVNQAVCCLRSGKRWVVTGTPIHNSLTDMFALLKFLRCSPFDENKVWKYWVANGSVQSQARLATIVNTLLLRRTKDQQGTDGKPLVSLPMKMVHDVYLVLNTDERTVYDLLYEVSRSLFRNYLKENGHAVNIDKHTTGITAEPRSNLVAPNQSGITLSANISRRTGLAALLVMLLRMQQCCCHLYLLKHVIAGSPTNADELKVQKQPNSKNAEDEMEDIVANLSALNLGNKTSTDTPANNAEAPNVARQIIQDCKLKLGPAFEKCFSSTKLKALLTALKELFKSHDSKEVIKSVVVSQWTSLLDIVAYHLDEAGITYCAIRGDVPIPERSKAVAEFNSRTSGPKVMLLSLKAGGVGLNLIGGSHLFLLDVHWNPAMESQAFDRIHRVGQIHNVHIHRFICNDTLEKKIVALQEKKKSLSKNILEGQNSKKSKLSLNDLRTLFGV